MRKIISLLLIAVMTLSALALVSCGGGSNEAESTEKESNETVDYSDSKYVGTWKITTLAVKDESKDFDEDWTIEMKPDGTGISISEGEEGKFTWKPTDKGLTTKGDINLEFTDDGDKIVGDLFGVKLTFIKQE